MMPFVSVRFRTMLFACSEFCNGTASIARLNGRLHNADAIRKGKISSNYQREGAHCESITRHIPPSFYQSTFNTNKSNLCPHGVTLYVRCVRRCLLAPSITSIGTARMWLMAAAGADCPATPRGHSISCH